VVKGFLTANEASERLGISATRVRQMIADNVIQGSQKAGTVYLIPEKEIVRLEGTERKAGRPRKDNQKTQKPR